MTDTVTIKFTGPSGTVRELPVPLTAWVGYKDGKPLTYYSTQGQADIGLRHHRIDSAIPAEHIAQNIAANAARARKARIAAKVARVYTPPEQAAVVRRVEARGRRAAAEGETGLEEYQA